MRGNEVVRVAATPVEPVDSTGAGDSFDAGFLAAHLDGAGLEAALALACACGALSTRAAGGTAAQPTLEEAPRAHVIVFVAASPSIDRTHEIEAPRAGRRSTGPRASSRSPAARR